MHNWSGLPPRALLAARLEALVTTTTVCVAIVLARVLWLSQVPLALIGSAVALALTLGAVSVARVTPRRHAAYRYRVSADALEANRGVLISSELLVPLSQVLFVDVRQGPIVRILGLATVRVGTVGSTHDIGPLEPSSARDLAQRIGRR